MTLQSKNQSQNFFAPGKRANVGINAINRKSAWIFLAPLFILLFIFLVLPMINSVRLSFSRWGGLGPFEPAGLENYKYLFSDAQMRYSVLITVVYAFAVAFLVVALGAILAAAISSGIRGHKFLKVIWFFPGIAPPTAVAIFWSGAFQPEFGAINVIFGKVGLNSGNAWLASSTTVLYPAIFVAAWAGVGFAFLVLLGAVEQIPVSVREAAVVDGANIYQQFTKITLPLIRPVLVTIFTLQVIWAFNGFTLLWALTNGGPADSTAILPILAYKEAFRYGRFGNAAAMAVVAGVFLLMIGYIGLRKSRSSQDL